MKPAIRKRKNKKGRVVLRIPRSLGTTVILDLGIRNLRFKVLPVSLTLCVAFELSWLKASQAGSELEKEYRDF